MLDFENQFYSDTVRVIVGLDEAGRGCLCGPVVAGAAIMPKDFYHPLINDSKKLTEKQREEAFKIITENALAYGIGLCSAKEIDEMNILNASRKAMMRALRQIEIKYDYILTDAMKLYDVDVPYQAVIKGDAKALCIAAASILAKVTRDHICEELDKQYPQYKIGIHKGYVTKAHVEALNKYGPIKDLYRFSYKPVQEALNKDLKLF
jgi:ribonuclease HII